MLRLRPTDYKGEHLLDDPVACILENIEYREYVMHDDEERMIEEFLRLRRLKQGFRCNWMGKEEHLIEVGVDEPAACTVFFIGMSNTVTTNVIFYLHQLRQRHPLTFTLLYVPLRRLPIAYDLWLAKQVLSVLMDDHYITDLWEALRVPMLHQLLMKASDNYQLLHGIPAGTDTHCTNEMALYRNKWSLKSDQATMWPVQVNRHNVRAYCATDTRYARIGLMLPYFTVMWMDIHLTLRLSSLSEELAYHLQTMRKITIIA
jgi:hypothetical protein